MIKIVYKKETHAIILNNLSYPLLMQKICDSFFRLPYQINLTYVDSQGDRICVSTTEDLKTVEKMTQKKTIKLQIEETGKEVESSTLKSKYLNIQNVQQQKQYQDVTSKSLEKLAEEFMKQSEREPFVKQNQFAQKLYNLLPKSKNQTIEQTIVPLEKEEKKEETVTNQSLVSEEQRLLSIAEFLQSTYDTTFEDALSYARQHKQKSLEQICEMYEYNYHHTKY